MNVLNALLWVIFTLLVSFVFGYLVQRMLGLRLGLIRLLLGGGLAVIVTQPIMAGLVLKTWNDGYRGQVGWFWLLAALAVLFTSMLFLVVAEAFVPYGSVPPAREWGAGLRGRLRRSRRYFQIVRILFRHGLWPYVRGGRRRALGTPAGRARFGAALTAALNDAGVTFVKLGQLLATRRDLVAGEVVDELKKLQDDAAPIGWDEAKAVLEAEFDAPLSQVFADIDERPLAAASVGQVHAATLLDGRRVVVKVQRPGISATVERDLDIAFRLADRLEAWTDWAASSGAARLAEGMAIALREELDYRVEAANLLAVAGTPTAGSSQAVRIPRVYPEWSGERVLVMERLDGVRLADAPNIADPLGTARTVLDFLLHQITVDGLFHADPHPGNILMLADGRIGLLDFGSVGRLDAALREALQRLLLGVDGADPLAVTDALLELIPRPEDVDIEELERDLGRFLARYVVGGALGSAGGAQMFGQLFRVVAAHRLAIPPEVAAVFRALGTVEGTLTEIAPRFDLVTEARRVAAGLAGERVSADGLKSAAVDELVSLAPILRRLPRRVERVMAAAEHGRFGINIRPLADERDRAFIRGLLNQVIITVIAATAGVMAVVLLSIAGGPQVTPSVSLYQLIGYNFLLVAAILGLRAVAPVFRHDRS
ncbi:ABC1 kinase family protein [Nakamurella lactea]|uniref:ABC1 kinase family protein n=1 Tax=Nakamurella lactea TaxID=459515 RepID=UPI000411EC6E|nr:AarF/UbiB family protein [Nakamurella lactea]